MNFESDTSSLWFKTKSGFKIYAACPACHSSNVSYFKERRDGLKGISFKSTGITPVCLDCGKNFPTSISKKKPTQPQFNPYKNA